MSQFVYSGQSDNSGKGKHKTDKVKMYKEKKNKNAKNRKSGQSGSFFSNKDIDIVLRYYSGKFSEGHCPPGLAKKTMVACRRGRLRNGVLTTHYQMMLFTMTCPEHYLKSWLGHRRGINMFALLLISF